MIHQNLLLFQIYLFFRRLGQLSLGALAVVLYVTARQADAAEPLAFKAAKLGTGVNQFLASNPEFKCSSPVNTVTTCLSTTSTFAGLEAKQVTAVFLAGALSNVEVVLVNGHDESIARFAYRTTEEALAAKNGPARAMSDKIGNLQRSIRIWSSEKASIQLSHATNGKVHIVEVMITRDDHWQRSVDLRKAKAKDDI